MCPFPFRPFSSESVEDVLTALRNGNLERRPQRAGYVNTRLAGRRSVEDHAPDPPKTLNVPSAILASRFSACLGSRPNKTSKVYFTAARKPGRSPRIGSATNTPDPIGVSSAGLAMIAMV